jgi:hypothetical protein
MGLAVGDSIGQDCFKCLSIDKKHAFLDAKFEIRLSILGLRKRLLFTEKSRVLNRKVFENLFSTFAKRIGFESQFFFIFFCKE